MHRVQLRRVAQFLDRLLPVSRRARPFPLAYTQAGLQLSWELDLWGRLRRLNEAARAQYLASEEARNGVIISLISDVMTTYFSLRELDLELDIGRQNNGIARDNLRLIRLRKDRGAANGLEVHQAEQFLYTDNGANRQRGAIHRDRQKTR